MAPLMFGALLVLVLAVVFAEMADGGIDAKAIAMLGVLSAIGAALRPLGAGTAGIETVLFTLVLAGRVFGPGFGFALGCTTMFASALITGGVGPWMPYQMFGCAWVGMFAGLLPPCQGPPGGPHAGPLRGAVRLRLRLHAEPVVLALLPSTPGARSPTCRGRRSPSTSTGTWSSTPPPRSGGTRAGPSPPSSASCWWVRPCWPPSAGPRDGRPSRRRWPSPTPTRCPWGPWGPWGPSGPWEGRDRRDRGDRYPGPLTADGPTGYVEERTASDPGAGHRPPGDDRGPGTWDVVLQEVRPGDGTGRHASCCWPRPSP